MDQGAAILCGLVIRRSAKLEWWRALAINLRQQSRVANGRGDEASTRALAQEATNISGRIAGCDPGKADWQQTY